MKTKVKFSIIVPIYNCEMYIYKCIDSILNQTYNNFELILVDDGSTDKSSEICDKYKTKDDRINVIHKENEGVTCARAVGVDISSGDFLVFIDSDDWIEKNYLQTFLNIIVKYNIDIVCCGSIYAYVDIHKNKKVSLNNRFGLYFKKDIIKEIFPKLIEGANGDYFSSSLWGKAFKKSIYIKTQFKNKLVNMGEDHACVKPAIYNSNNIYILSECLYHYRQNPQSLTKSKKVINWEMPKVIAQHFESTINMNYYDFQNQVYRNCVHNLFNVASSQFNTNKKYTEVANNIKKNLNDEYYQNAIKRCKYNYLYLKGILSKFALKHKLIFLIYIYNMVSNYAKKK